MSIHSDSYNNLCGHFPGLRKADKKELKRYRQRCKQEAKDKKEAEINDEFDEIKNHLRIKYILESTEQRIVIQDLIKEEFIGKSNYKLLEDVTIGGITSSDPQIILHFKHSPNSWDINSQTKDIISFVRELYKENAFVYSIYIDGGHARYDWDRYMDGILLLIR